MSWEPSDPDDDLLTPREVAEMFGVRTTTLARWSRSGVLNARLTPGGHRRYRRGDVLAILGRGSKPDPEQEEREKDAARLYDQGWPIRRIAREFGHSYGAMRRILLRHTKLRDRTRP